MKNKNNKTLASLIQTWDKKLKESGFEDIECRKTGLLKQWSGKIFYGSTLITDDNFLDKINKINKKFGYGSLTYKESEVEYFRLASQCLHDKEFKSEIHKNIWELHSDGFSYSEISTKLNITRRQVRYAIECMAKAFCLK